MSNFKKVSIPIYGIRFSKKDAFGDFNWMCKQPRYKRSLFLFNDNEEKHYTNQVGGGNAIIRKYNLYSGLKHPLAAGIPTGTLRDGGYTKFDMRVKKIIDDSFLEIKCLLQLLEYDAIYYSVNEKKKLGTNIFKVNQDVLRYIENNIQDLSQISVTFIT